MSKSRVKKGISDLETLYPEVALDWDYEQNNMLPSEVSAHSHDYAYWKCHICGHQWKAVINSRSAGRGCPACGGQVVIFGKNDLASNFPEIAAEWDYDANYPVTPEIVSKGAIKKYYWICPECNYSYEASVNQRTNSKSACPYCSNHKVMPGYNDFETQYPQLVKEWDYDKNGGLKPNMVLCNRHEKVFWKCPNCGNSYEAYIYNRIRGDGCSFCSGHQVLEGFNDLSTVHPELLNEWDYESNRSPSEYTAGSNQKVNWICSVCGHHWKTEISKRSNGSQCPKCNKRNHTSFPEQAIIFYVKKIFPDAINSYTDIFPSPMELDVFIPSIAVGIEYDGVQWHNSMTENREKEKYAICKENGITLIRVREGKNDSPYCDFNIACSYRRRDYGGLDDAILRVFECLNISSPAIDTESDAVSINEQFLVMKKEGSFGAMFPQYCEEWDSERNGSLSPYMFTPYSNEPVWWICQECNNPYKMTLADKAQGHGCLKCSYKKRGQLLSEKMKKKVRNIDTGEVFISITEASKHYGGSAKSSHIGECCKGKIKTAYGYHWEYYQDCY